MPRHLLSAVLLPLVAPALAAQAKWTVDDNGPADFSSLQTAVDTVAPGDILLIEPGNYGVVLVNKPITLLGSPGSARPVIASLDFLNIERFDALHLEVLAFAATNISAHAFIDDCLIKSGTTTPTTFNGCADVAIANSTFQAANQSVQGVSGLVLANCGYVQVVNSSITGGIGDPSMITFEVGVGGSGILVQQSTLLLVGSFVKGGAGKDVPLIPPFPGKGGTGLSVGTGSKAEVRGSTFDSLGGGQNNFGIPGSGIGLAVRAEPGATVAVSGVSTSGGFNGTVSSPAPRPYIEWSGSGGPGSSRQIAAYGTAGTTAVAVLATSPFLDTGFAAEFGLPLLVHPGTIFLTPGIVLLGQNLPNGPIYNIPPGNSLAGAKFFAQAAVLQPPTISATNATELILSF